MDTRIAVEPPACPSRVVGLPVLWLGLALLRSAPGTARDSCTIDETWHAVTGVAYVRHGDFALNPEHPRW